MYRIINGGRVASAFAKNRRGAEFPENAFGMRFGRTLSWMGWWGVVCCCRRAVEYATGAGTVVCARTVVTCWSCCDGVRVWQALVYRKYVVSVVVAVVVGTFRHTIEVQHALIIHLTELTYVPTKDTSVVVYLTHSLR